MATFQAVSSFQIQERSSERPHHDGGERECSRLDRGATPQCGARGKCHCPL